MRQITLAILAGGSGRRMGIPKAHLHINNVPILIHLLRRFQWPGPTLVVTSPHVPTAPGVEHFDQLAIDPTADQGPLRAIHTALQSSTTDFVLAATVDMLSITAAHLNWLAAHTGPAGLMLTRHFHLEPFPSVWHKNLAPSIQTALDQNRCSVQAMSPLLTLLQAPPDWPPQVWQNLNHPSEWNHFLETQAATAQPK